MQTTHPQTTSALRLGEPGQGGVGHRERLNAAAFLDALVAELPHGPHRLQTDCDATLQLPADVLDRLGTIVWEAVSNAVAHAFPAGREGRIWVRLNEARGRLTLTIRDDGKGIPDLHTDSSRGRRVIDGTAHELGGYARLGSAPFGGGLVSVVFSRQA